jgi:hypothetical protein
VGAVIRRGPNTPNVGSRGTSCQHEPCGSRAHVRGLTGAAQERLVDRLAVDGKAERLPHLNVAQRGCGCTQRQAQYRL